MKKFPKVKSVTVAIHTHKFSELHSAELVIKMKDEGLLNGRFWCWWNASDDVGDIDLCLHAISCKVEFKNLKADEFLKLQSTFMEEPPEVNTAGETYRYMLSLVEKAEKEEADEEKPTRTRVRVRAD